MVPDVPTGGWNCAVREVIVRVVEGVTVKAVMVSRPSVRERRVFSAVVRRVVERVEKVVEVVV